MDIDRLRAALADRYAIEHEIGVGGMATVYLAQDLRHARSVAVKVLRSDLSQQLGAPRFLNEVTIAAGLSHPHILPLFDSGERDGILFFVMPFVEGESLRSKLSREGTLPVRDAVKILRDVADALAYAHAQTVVHRDIKPDNVLLSGRHAMVADFGVAKALSEATSRHQLTTEGVALGTPSYMAPEQAAAEPDIDHRADIYAFGALAYECLSGEPPFTGSHQAVLAAHVTRAPEAISSRRDGLPSVLSRLVMRCLQKAPADRHQTMDDVLTQLESAVTPSGGSTPTGVRAAKESDVLPSVAVLPFKNMSADPENEYFADGMTEEIINALSHVEGLQVASRTSAFAFKGREKDIRTIGEELNVGAVLEGSVRQAGRRIRVTAQLVNVADGYQRWSERYDRDMEDVFAVQDEIAVSITEALEARLATPSAGSKRATDVEAYKLYLKGRFQWNKRTNATMRQAIALFEQALERDPGYAPAYAGIADCYGLLGWVAFGAMPPHDAFPKAEAAARRALELDDSLAEAHNTLGWTRLVYGWDRAAAESAFRRALELNPQYAMAHSWYGLHLAWTGRSDEAITSAERAMELDPLSLIIHTLAGWVLYFAGCNKDSIGLYSKALELEPNYVRAYLGRGQAYEQEGDVDRAVAEFEKGVALSGGSPRYVAALGRAYALAGERQAAEMQLDRLRELGEQTFVSAAYLATVLGGLGDVDGMLDELEQALEERSGALVYLHVDPQYEGVRELPRFQALLKSVGLPGS